MRARRDFTVNALFYDPVREEMLDYHDGVADLKARKLRMIGDPAQRYREDPVRMLRAVRLAAKLRLEIEPRTRKPIRALADLLHNVPPARLFDEMLKLLLSGHAADGVRRLRKEGLHHGLLPLLDVILEQPLGERFVMLALENTDERIRAGKPVSPGFLFAALLWHEVLAAWKQAEARGMNTDAGAVSGDGPGDAGAGREARHSAPLRRRHEGNLGAAAALCSTAPDGVRTACSSTCAFAPATISCCCAARAAKSTRKSATGGTKFQHADEATRAGMLLRTARAAAKSAAAAAAQEKAGAAAAQRHREP